MSAYRTSVAYCSGRDQMVRVIRKSEFLGLQDDGATGPHAVDLVCLEVGSECTGVVCPLFEVPRGDMAVRLREAGLL